MTVRTRLVMSAPDRALAALRRVPRLGLRLQLLRGGQREPGAAHGGLRHEVEDQRSAARRASWPSRGAGAVVVLLLGEAAVRVPLGEHAEHHVAVAVGGAQVGRVGAARVHGELTSTGLGDGTAMLMRIV